MKETIKFDDISVLQQVWGKFSSQLFQEIKSLRDIKRGIEVEKRKLETVSRIIKKSENDIEFMLKHKNVFTNLNSSFEGQFQIIETFFEIGALDNPAVLEYVSQILKSDEVSNIDADINKLSADIDNISDKISKIEELRTGSVFDADLIEKYSSKFGYDKMIYRQLMLYPVVKIVHKKDKKISPNKGEKKVSVDSVIEDIKKANELEEVKHEEVKPEEIKPKVENESSSVYISDSMISGPNVTSTKGKRNKTVNEYRQLISRFEKLKNKYRIVINEYKKYLHNFTEEDISKLIDFCTSAEKEFHNDSELYSIDEYVSRKMIILTYELVGLTSEINKEKNIGYSKVTADIVSDMGHSIDYFEELASKLEKLDFEGNFSYQSIFAEENRIKKFKEDERKAIEAEKQKRKEEEIQREKNKDRFSILSSKYDELLEKYKDLFNKYSRIIYEMKPEEKSIYDKFSSIVESDLINIINSSFGTNEDEVKVKLMAMRIFDLKKEIEQSSENVNYNKYDNDSVDEYELYIEEIERLAKSLELHDSKLVIEDKIEEEVSTQSSVYFFVDDKGNPIIGDKQDELLPIYARMSRVSEVDNMIKKKPLILKDITSLGRKPIIQRVGNSLISFVPIETEEGKCIFVFDSAMIYDGSYAGVHKNTIKIVNQHASELKRQIGLIETLDPKFLDVQAAVRENLKQYLPNMKGEN